MKKTLTVLLLLGFALAFITCDDDNGKDDGIEDAQDPCPCTDKVHYDTPCDCVGVGNDCDCTVVYKPALTDVFAFGTSTTPEVQSKVAEAYNAIWASNPQLLLRLLSAVAVKGSPINITYGVNDWGIEFVPELGRIRITCDDITDVDIAEFTTAFETAIGEACDYYESQ